MKAYKILKPEEWDKIVYLIYGLLCWSDRFLLTTLFLELTNLQDKKSLLKP